ncbi:nuclear pore complex protein NUP62-like [Quercus robur]|uniref:nuclear pore complex protein NUP62-like n=1 Tax=Quercus robur TaxID=38942 RepID=UPI002161CFF6|nr:nuclear pore complex protein NUP62-like [Quercus robur]
MNSEFIERELEQMTEQIKSLIQTLNANQGGELEAVDGMTRLDVVVRILNNQLSSLMWLDGKAEAELQTDNVMDEVNLANVVDNIHYRRLEVCEFSFTTFRNLFMKQM